ncbi:unnamed protein product [Ectocarpus sp. 12 AP-2014]
MLRLSGSCMQCMYGFFGNRGNGAKGRYPVTCSCFCVTTRIPRALLLGIRVSISWNFDYSVQTNEREESSALFGASHMPPIGFLLSEKIDTIINLFFAPL